jgi:hypothetical protein
MMHNVVVPAVCASRMLMQFSMRIVKDNAPGPASNAVLPYPKSDRTWPNDAAKSRDISHGTAYSSARSRRLGLAKQKSRIRFANMLSFGHLCFPS